MSYRLTQLPIVSDCLWDLGVGWRLGPFPSSARARHGQLAQFLGGVYIGTPQQTFICVNFGIIVNKEVLNIAEEVPVE